MRNFYKTRNKTKQFFYDIQSNKIQTRLKKIFIAGKIVNKE